MCPKLLCNCNHYLAHVEETSSVFVTSKSTEKTWFHPKWTCGCGDFSDTKHYTCYGGGDAFMIGLSKDSHWNGAWCDWHKESKFNFICEGNI